MTEDLIRYDILAQDALRGVVKTVLTEVARTGLPGEHHFYITFNTQAPGVRISPRLLQKYPQDMTIVLQHQFWDLQANDQAVELGLSFDGIPEKLYVPYTSIITFIDPSVHFSLQFEVETEFDEEDLEAEASNEDSDSVLTVMPVPQDNAHKAEAGIEAEASDEDEAASEETKSNDENAEEQVQSEEAEDSSDKEEDDKTPNAGAEVVSLDAFRKK